MALPKSKLKVKDLQKFGKEIPAPPADLPEPGLSENAAYIAKTRYAFRDENGTPIEGPKEMFWRVAYNIATADRNYNGNSTSKTLETARKFYNMMASQEYIPNTPTMVNAGKPNQQLSACFVLPVEDSMTAILKTMSDMAMIHKSGGGTGFSFSRLRPYGDVIGSSRGTTVGPVSFMQAYNDVTTQIKQGGVRRGANMGILHITHPDILRFAVHKVDEFSLTNFNISVTVTEDFMETVRSDSRFIEGDESLNVEELEEIVSEIRAAQAIRDVDLKLVKVEEGVKKLYELTKATQEGEGYELINPRTNQVAGKLNAKKVFDLITRLAWQYGDPGMILIDRINNSRANPVPRFGMIEATNPCGEQPLHPYDACTLGSINLNKFRKGKTIDWDRLKDAIHESIHFLDNVLDMNEYPLPEIHRTTRAIRRVGLGVMGFADLLAGLGIGYNTDEAFKKAEEIMKFFQEESDNASEDLAKIRGNFGAYEGSIYDGVRPMRNGARTTIAPTGTISMLADCSSGIEPHFALTYAKNTVEGKRLFNTIEEFVKAAKKENIYSDELLEKIQDNKGSVQGLKEVPESLQKVFVVAGDISPEQHVKMQAAFQHYTDNAISKTINFNNDATVEDVRNAYWLAYEQGCKGITIYRDGSRDKQVLETKKEDSYYDQLAGKKKSANNSAEQPHFPILPIRKPTPSEAWGMRIRKPSDVGNVYTSVFRNAQNEPVEVFVNIGKSGAYVSGAAEVTGRLGSLALKYGASLEEVASELVGISCGTQYGVGPNAIYSAFDAVGKSLIEIATAKQLNLLSQDLISQDEKPVSADDNLSSSNSHTRPSSGTVVQESLIKEEPLALEIKSPLEHKVVTLDINNSCPQCGSPLAFKEGCKSCINPLCGWSKCS